MCHQPQQIIKTYLAKKISLHIGGGTFSPPKITSPFVVPLKSSTSYSFQSVVAQPNEKKNRKHTFPA